MAIISICCLTLPGVYNLANFIDYSLNTQKYLDTCENVEEPEVQCNGMCQLVDDLVNADSSDQEEKATLTISDIPFFVVPAETCTLVNNAQQLLNGSTTPQLLDEYAPSCFHPPCV